MKRAMILAGLVMLMAASCSWADVAITEANFPDLIFREYVSQFDGDNNGVLSDGEISAVDGIYVSESSVSSIKGVEHFRNIKALHCRSNNITGVLDLHGCTALTIIYARNNDLAELNVTGCDALEILHCHTNVNDGEDYSNHITTLDLAGKINLQDLRCARNRLTELDVSDCTALISLDCQRNMLSSLNVANNTALKSLNCGSNDIKSLNVTNNTALTRLEAWDCGLSEIDVSKNTELDYLELGGLEDNSGNHNKLTSINVDNNTKLTYLAVDRNQLTALDVSKLPLLEVLLFHINSDMKEIDLSHNPALKELYCRDCKLTALDLSANTNLEILRCHNNPLLTLDLSHNPKIATLSCDTASTSANYPLVVKTSGNANYLYYTDMSDYTGSNFTRITSLNAYKSLDITVDSSFSPQSSSLAMFTECPVRVVYLYDLGYTGTANIKRTMTVTLTGSGIPQTGVNTTSGDNSHIHSSGGGCNMSASVLCVLAALGLALRKH